MNLYRPTICVDFDGVIHSYTSGWKGIDKIPDPPVAGALEWLRDVLDFPVAALIGNAPASLFPGVHDVPKSRVQVVIYSSRSRTLKGRRAMRRWFAKYLGAEYLEVLRFPKKKPAAFLTIDDRAIWFKGTFPTIDEMLAFKPWEAEK